jgi:hypothetical protein
MPGETGIVGRLPRNLDFGFPIGNHETLGHVLYTSSASGTETAIRGSVRENTDTRRL